DGRLRPHALALERQALRQEAHLARQDVRAAASLRRAWRKDAEPSGRAARPDDERSSASPSYRSVASRSPNAMSTVPVTASIARRTRGRASSARAFATAIA